MVVQDSKDRKRRDRGAYCVLWWKGWRASWRGFEWEADHKIFIDALLLQANNDCFSSLSLVNVASWVVDGRSCLNAWFRKLLNREIDFYFWQFLGSFSSSSAALSVPYKRDSTENTNLCTPYGRRIWCFIQIKPIHASSTSKLTMTVAASGTT
jgi:hypothetical protein